MEQRIGILPPRICYGAHLAHPFLGFLGTQNLNFNSRDFRSPSLLLGVSLSCPTPNCATRGLICAIAQNYRNAFLDSPTTRSEEFGLFCSSRSSSSSLSSCLVFGNKRSSCAGRGIASLQLTQAVWTYHIIYNDHTIKSCYTKLEGALTSTKPLLHQHRFFIATQKQCLWNLWCYHP